MLKSFLLQNHRPPERTRSSHNRDNDARPADLTPPPIFVGIPTNAVSAFRHFPQNSAEQHGKRAVNYLA